MKNYGVIFESFEAGKQLVVVTSSGTFFATEDDLLKVVSSNAGNGQAYLFAETLQRVGAVQ